MSKVLTTCFRFNMDNPEHAKAWDYLHNFDKDKIKSTNVAAITAVNDYFDRMGRLADDPYFETRQREERFVEQIVSEVGKAFIAEMPKFLASLMLSLLLYQSQIDEGILCVVSPIFPLSIGLLLLL